MQATENDGTQVITLAEAAPDAAGARRPSWTAPLKGIDLQTTEHLHWQINQRGAVLTAQIHYAVARGKKPQLLSVDGGAAETIGLVVIVAVSHGTTTASVALDSLECSIIGLR